MGVGKSTIGRQIVRRLHKNFIDIDLEIEKNEHASIREIIATRGEHYFRAIEAIALANAMTHDDTIVSCGGGLPCYNDHILTMRKNGIVICIQQDLETIYERLKKEKTARPLLADLCDEELKEYISTKLEERKWYYHMAHFITSKNEPLEEILTFLQS
jgi:shikimate kinase